MTNPGRGASWQKTLLPITATVHEAIKSLDQSALQIVLVVSDDGGLVGTVCDGDIRRGLLQGLDLTSPLERVVHRDPLVVPPDFGRDMVLQLMRANRVHQVPVVDERKRVVGLHVLDELMAPKKHSHVMVIMAGGKGTRLRPHTNDCPKPLLPVAGKPMIEHLILRGKLEGFQHFVISINYLGHMIESYCGDGRKWQVEIKYLRESEPMGTAGALTLLEPRPGTPFVVANGDVLTDIRYSDILEFHGQHSAAATMAVRLHEWQHPFGIVQTKGIDIVGFEEKPVARSHVNAGIYVLEPAATDALIRGEPCDMPTLFARLQQDGRRTIVYPMHEPWLDVGRPEDYDAANQM